MALEPRSNRTPMMKLRDVCRNYQVGGQSVHALDHVDLDIEAGEYISIMGPSGSGKSTLLNILGLLDRPSSGRYWLQGSDVADLDDDALARLRQQQIGFIFQSFHLIARLNALENVELPMLLAGQGAGRRQQRARGMLESVGLGGRAEHRPDQLSGGERQRVAIARAMIMQPAVLLADEPTGNLDSHSGEEIIELIEQLNRDGIALLVVTHDRALGQRATRHLLMHDGKIHSDEGRRHDS
jgi:putative ABC transport system ATP-binding protein